MSSSEAFARVVIYRYYTLQPQLCWDDGIECLAGLKPRRYVSKNSMRRTSSQNVAAALRGRGAASS